MKKNEDSKQKTYFSSIRNIWPFYGFGIYLIFLILDIFYDKTDVSENPSVVLGCTFLILAGSATVFFTKKLREIPYKIADLLDNNYFEEWKNAYLTNLHSNKKLIYAGIFFLLGAPIKNFYTGESGFIDEFGTSTYYFYLFTIWLPITALIGIVAYLMLFEWIWLYSVEIGEEITFLGRESAGKLEPILPATNFKNIRIKIKPFHIDGFGGLHPLAELGVLGMFLLIIGSSIAYISVIVAESIPGGDYGNLTLAWAIVTIILIFFIVMMKGMHKLLKTEKIRMLQKVAERLSRKIDYWIQTEELEELEKTASTIAAIDAAYKVVDSLREWPIDLQILAIIITPSFTPLLAFLIKILII